MPHGFLVLEVLKDMSPVPGEAGHAWPLISFFILSVIVGITKSFFSHCEENVILYSSNLKHRQPRLTAPPHYLIILPVAFHLPDHFKKQCIVNTLSEMGSNTYSVATTLFITINVSGPLHPPHTFIALAEMSDVFATVITP